MILKKPCKGKIIVDSGYGIVQNLDQTTGIPGPALPYGRSGRFMNLILPSAAEYPFMGYVKVFCRLWRENFLLRDASFSRFREAKS